MNRPEEMLFDAEARPSTRRYLRVDRPARGPRLA
jgi:hypothetical protein